MMLLAILLAATAFDPAATNVGPDFKGDDFIAVFRSLMVEPKGEFETTEQFEARKKAPPPAVYAFVAPKPDARYDADAAAFTVELTRYDAKGAYGQFIDSLIAVVDKIDSSRFYDASNAFGVSVKVYQRTIGRWGIVIPDEPQRYLKLKVPVPPDRAQALKDRLSLMVVVRTNAESRPLVSSKDKLETGSSYEKPTIKRPEEATIYEHGLEADLLGIWVFDRESGEVLAKFDAIGQGYRADGTIEYHPAQYDTDVVKRVRAGMTPDQVRDASKPLPAEVKKKRGGREEWLIGNTIFEFADGKLVGLRSKSTGKPLELRPHFHR